MIAQVFYLHIKIVVLELSNTLENSRTLTEKAVSERAQKILCCFKNEL